MALRGKVRLSPERLGRLNALIEELQQLLRDAKAERTDPLYVHTNADRVLSRVQKAIVEALRQTAQET